MNLLARIDDVAAKIRQLGLGINAQRFKYETRITELEAQLSDLIDNAFKAIAEYDQENTDLKAQLAATNQKYLQVTAQTCRAEDLAESLQAQLTAVQKDAARLDWIFANCETYGQRSGFMLEVFVPVSKDDPRQAIDAAIQAEGKEA